MEETKQLYRIGEGLITLALIVVVGMAILQGMSSGTTTISYASASDNFTSTSQTKTLSPVGELGIQSATIKTNNNTWLEFDGVDDEGDFGDSDLYSLNTTGGLTLSFWIKPNASNLNTRLASKGGSSNFEYTFVMNPGSDSKLDVLFQLFNLSGSSSMENADFDYGAVTKSFPIDKWTFISINLENSSVTDSSRAYTDLEVTDYMKLTNNIGNGNSVLKLAEGWAGNKFKGSIDEFRIYNRTLTRNETLNLYHTTKHDSRNPVPIIYYHSIDNTEGFEPVTIGNFTNQMNHLNDNSFTPITIEQYINYTREELDFINPIIIMFDDGYDSVMDEAKSILDGHSFVANVNVITELANNDGTTAYLNWTELQNLSDEGWGINSHSVNATSLMDMSLDIRTKMFNDSYNDIKGNLSITPYGFIFPQNARNITLNAECGNYYEFCTGEFKASNTNQYWYAFDNSNLTNGDIRRIEIRSNTTLNQFIEAVEVHNSTFYSTEDINSGLVGHWRFDENTGTTAYDSSGNGNNGTITGATWNNDGVLITLVNGVDYTLNTATGLLNLSIIQLYNWIESSWNYGYSNDEGGIFTNTEYFQDQLGTGGLAGYVPAIIAVIIGISLISYFLGKKEGN
jgi:hypothetical protein